MEDNKLNKGIEDIKEIKMTSEEKERVLHNILHSPRPSPYLFISIFHRRSFVYSLSAFCLVVILGGGTVFASAGSLPGNMLYPLKVKVVEPVAGAFVFSPIAKVEYQNSLATKRLIEAETLAKKGKLDASKEEELNVLLETHATAFHKAVIDLGQSENFDQAKNDDIITSFEATMNAHARILNIARGREDVIGENRDTKISETAKNNAKKVRESFRNKDQAPSKDQVQDQNPDEVIDTDHERLLDSQSAAKEAEIFLKAGLELEVKSGI